MNIKSSVDIFDITLYSKLASEDQEIINEYITKMMPGELNSFMKRLLDHYVLEAKEDTLEVNEDIYYPGINENYKVPVLSRKVVYNTYNNKNIIHNKQNIIHKIPFERIMKCIEHTFVNVKENSPQEYLYMALKKYFEEEYQYSIYNIVSSGLVNDDNVLYTKGFNGFLSDTQLQHELYYKYSDNAYRVGWTPIKNINNRISEIYIDLAKNNKIGIRSIQNVMLPLCFYTYRVEQHNKNKLKAGIAIDRRALSNGNMMVSGFSKNFNMYKKFINIKMENNNVDITSFIKKISYWSPKNAERHGFDKKTGVIWFNGDYVNNKWKLPNDMLIENNTNVNVSGYYTDDAFSKMLQRFNFNNKIDEIITQLKKENIYNF